MSSTSCWRWKCSNISRIPPPPWPRCAASPRAVALTVPLEPFFRTGNLVRGRYVGRLGSTPGHLNTWGPAGLRRALDQVLPASRWFEPFPWQGLIADTGPARADHGGQRALETHFEQWVDATDSDFRTGSLNQLVADALPTGRTLDTAAVQEASP